MSFTIYQPIQHTPREMIDRCEAQGAEARYRGQPRDGGGYVAHSDEWCAWHRGWDDESRKQHDPNL